MMINALLLLALCLVFPTSSWALDTGFQLSNNRALISNEWGNSVNLHADDGAFAEARANNAGKDQQDTFDYQFVLPSGSTIDGVEAAFEAKLKSSSHTGYIDCQLIKNGTLTGDVKSTTSWTTTSFVIRYLGGASDGWNASLTEADVEATQFGIYCTAKIDTGSDPRLRVDYMKLKVYYTEAGTAERRVMTVQ